MRFNKSKISSSLHFHEKSFQFSQLFSSHFSPEKGTFSYLSKSFKSVRVINVPLMTKNESTEMCKADTIVHNFVWRNLSNISSPMKGEIERKKYVCTIIMLKIDRLRMPWIEPIEFSFFVFKLNKVLAFVMRENALKIQSDFSSRLLTLEWRS